MNSYSYNRNGVLGLYMYIINYFLPFRELIAMNKGPDIIYAVSFAHVQISATGVIAVIYVPKVNSFHNDYVLVNNR